MERIARMVLTALIGGGLLLMAGTADEVTQAEKAWASAVVKGDLATLDKMLAPELIYTHSSSVVENKAVYFGKLKSGALKYESIQHEEIVVKAYGDAAVLHCKVQMKGVSGGAPFTAHAVMTHVWVKQGGRWQLAAHQATKLP
jgi:ketosteroid isomerase-like protein